MQPNVIYLSDASFDPLTNVAGIGVKNLSSDQIHTESVYAGSVCEAEEFALIAAIDHASYHGYRNCVFVYDNLGIDTEALKRFYEPLFEKLQFMWFKREYLEEVDSLAKKARPKKTVFISRVERLRQLLLEASEAETIAMFLPYARGEVYGYLSALGGIAPMYKALPKHYSRANDMVIAILWQFGGKPLHSKLLERFGRRAFQKHKHFEAFLSAIGFDERFAEEARFECRGIRAA